MKRYVVRAFAGPVEVFGDDLVVTEEGELIVTTIEGGWSGYFRTDQWLYARLADDPTAEKVTL